MESARNVTARGPVAGSNLRVVWDDEHVVVVSQQNTTYLKLDGAVEKGMGGRLSVPTTDGLLTLVKQGGCACGKPWLSRPSDQDLLASVPA